MDNTTSNNDAPATPSEISADLIARMEEDDELAFAYAVEEKFQQAWTALEEVAETIASADFPDEIDWSDVTLTRDEALAKFEAAQDELRYIQAYLYQHARDHFERVRRASSRRTGNR